MPLAPEVADATAVIPAPEPQIGIAGSPESSEAAAAVAIAGVTPSVLGEVVEASQEIGAPETLRHREDIPVAIGAIVLAVSVFLPWYEFPGAADSVNAWQSGTWGPVTFFLALGSLVVIALRNLRIPVGLPVSESVLQEAVGWICTGLALVKARVIPQGMQPVGFLLSTPAATFLAVAAGLSMALAASRVSGKVPIVFLPGWHKGRAGKTGVVLLGLIVAGAVAFAFGNTSPSGSPGPRARKRPVANQVFGRIPECATGFPIPASLALQPGEGYNGSGRIPCFASFIGNKTHDEAAKAFTDELNKAKYAFRSSQSAPGTTTFVLTQPQCGTVSVMAREDRLLVQVIIQTCASPAPT